jgi:hypothetical protein
VQNRVAPRFRQPLQHERGVVEVPVG